MKTKFNAALIACSFLLMLNFTAKAQIPFTNNLNCPVEVGYEEWYLNANNTCAVACQFGSFTILPGATYNYQTCTPFVDLCIWVIDIGGTPVNGGGCYNHRSTNFCCGIAPTGQNGSCGPISCFPAGTWNINYNIPFSWSIQ